MWDWYSCSCPCLPIKDYWKKVKKIKMSHIKGISGHPSGGNQRKHNIWVCTKKFCKVGFLKQGTSWVVVAHIFKLSTPKTEAEAGRS